MATKYPFFGALLLAILFAIVGYIIGTLLTLTGVFPASINFAAIGTLVGALIGGFKDFIPEF